MTANEHPEPAPVTAKEHLPPKVSTVKLLYATALRCAKPDCPRPLFNQNNDTAELTLNSRMAHIHARRAGGARWIEMSEEDNRSESNLVVLCIEHSYEIDELPDRYPAEMLRQWKQAQLEEHQQAQRGWNLSDVDAGRVLEATRAAEDHHAGAVIDAVRAVERLALAARSARRGPASQVTVWRAARAQARTRQSCYDLDGNTVHAELSPRETRQHKAALEEALAETREALSPSADAVKVELAAVRAGRPAISPWAAWVSRAADVVVHVSGTWPGLPDLEDDQRLETAVFELTDAIEALSAAWRGEEAAPPPPEPELDPSPVVHDPLQEHAALLERARPYARVVHRPYDALLRAELAVAAERAAEIPPVLSTLSVGLSTTCALAAAVAANAKDDELVALAQQDAQRRPLSAAVLLLAESARIAAKRGRPAPQEKAETALTALWNSIDWSDLDSWNPEDQNLVQVLWHGSRITSPETVKELLSKALKEQPDILPFVITACANWVEVHDSHDWSILPGFRRRYRELPSWFPTRAVVEATVPAARVTVSDSGETDRDDAESLLAQVLWLAARAST